MFVNLFVLSLEMLRVVLLLNFSPDLSRKFVDFFVYDFGQFVTRQRALQLRYLFIDARDLGIRGKSVHEALKLIKFVCLYVTMQLLLDEVEVLFHGRVCSRHFYDFEIV